MLKKILIGTTLLLMSSLAQASLIEYNGYSRDSSSNIVTGGGLEWLMWDVTKGMSISNALTMYASDGWTLASHVQMIDLFNIFQFGKTDWDSSIDTIQSHQTPWTEDELSIHNDFISLFGITFLGNDCSLPNQCYDVNDPYVLSSAIYGEISGLDAVLWRYAHVVDDYTGCIGEGCTNHNFNAHAMINSFNTTLSPADMSSEFRGVALVRQINSPPSPVPLPSSLSILVLGLMSLVYRRKN